MLHLLNQLALRAEVTACSHPPGFDQMQNKELICSGEEGRGLAAAVTKMNGVIPAAQMVISLFVTVAPSESDSVGV